VILPHVPIGLRYEPIRHYVFTRRTIGASTRSHLALAQVPLHILWRNLIKRLSGHPLGQILPPPSCSTWLPLCGCHQRAGLIPEGVARTLALGKQAVAVLLGPPILDNESEAAAAFSDVRLDDALVRRAREGFTTIHLVMVARNC